MVSQLKDFFKRNEADIVLVIGIIIISLISFGGGWIMATSNSKIASKTTSKDSNNDEIKIEENALETEGLIVIKKSKGEISQKEINGTVQEKENSQPKKSDKEETEETNKNSSQSSICKYVGSKNSDIYHLPDCPGAQRIKEENKRCFNSKSEAEKAGYRPAKNCPGI